MRRWVLIIVFATLLTSNCAGVDKGSDVEMSADDDYYMNESTDKNDDPVPVTKSSNPNTTKERWKVRRAIAEKKIRRKIWKDIRQEVRDMKNNVLPGLTGNLSWMEVDVRDMNRHLFSMVGDIRFIKNEVLYIKRQAHVIWENVTDTRRDHKRMNRTLWMILNNVTLMLSDVEKTAGQVTNMEQNYGTIGDQLGDAVDKVGEFAEVPATLRSMNLEFGELKTTCSRSTGEMTDELGLVREIVSKLGLTILDIKDYVTKEFPQVDQNIMYLGGVQSRILSNVTTVALKVDQQTNIMTTVANTIYDVSKAILTYTQKLMNILNLLNMLDQLLKKVDRNIITVNEHLEYFTDRVSDLDSRVDNIQESIFNITTETSKVGMQVVAVSSNLDHHFYNARIHLGSVHDKLISNVSILKNDLEEIKAQLTQIRDVITEKCGAKFPPGEIDNGIVEIHDNEVPHDTSSSDWSGWPETSTMFPPGRPPTGHPPGYPPIGVGLPGIPVDPGHPHPILVPSQNGIPPQIGLPAENGLPPQNGFPPQNGAPSQNGFPPANGYPPDVGYPPAPATTYQPPTWSPPPTWPPVTSYPTTFPPTPLPGYPSVYPPIVPTLPPAYPHPPITIYPTVYPTVAYPHVPPSSYPPAITVYPPTMLPPSYPLLPIAPMPEYPPPSQFPPIPGYPGPTPTESIDKQELPSTTPSASRPMYPPDPQAAPESGAQLPIGVPLGPAGPGLPIGFGDQFTGHCACICPCDCICPTVELKSIAKTNAHDQFSNYRPKVDVDGLLKQCFCLCSCPCPESITAEQINGHGNGERPGRPMVPPFQPPPVPLPPGALPPALIPPHIPAMPTPPAALFPGWIPQLDEGMCLNAFNQILEECMQIRQEIVKIANITALEHELTRRIIIDEMTKRFDYIQKYMQAYMDNLLRHIVQSINMTRILQNQMEQAKESAVLSLEIIARNIVKLHRQLAGQWSGSPIPESPMIDRQPTFLPAVVPQPELAPGFQIPEFTAPGEVPSYLPSRPQIQFEGSPHLISPNYLPIQPSPHPTGTPPRLQSPIFPDQPTERPLSQLIGKPSGTSLEELIGRLSPGGQPPESLTPTPNWFSSERHNFSHGLPQPPREDYAWMVGRKHTGEAVTNTTQISTSSEVAQRMFPNNEKNNESTINITTTAGKSKRKSRKDYAMKRKYVTANQDLPMSNTELNENEVESEAYDKGGQGLLHDVGIIPDEVINMPNTEMPVSEHALDTIQAPIDPFAFHNLLQDQINHQLMNAMRPGLAHRSKRKRLSSGRSRGRSRIRYKPRPRPMFPMIPGFPFIQPPRIPQIVLPKPVAIIPPQIPNIFDQLPPGIMTAGINGSPYSISYNDGRGSSWNVNVNRRHYESIKHENDLIESNEDDKTQRDEQKIDANDDQEVDDDAEDEVKTIQNDEDKNTMKEASGSSEQR